MKYYFYNDNGNVSNPFLLDEFKKLNFHDTTLVWCQGLETWVKASELPELREVVFSTPPLPPPLDESRSVFDVMGLVFFLLLSVAQIFSAVFLWAIIPLAIYGIACFAHSKHHSRLYKIGLLIPFFALFLIIIRSLPDIRLILLPSCIAQIACYSHTLQAAFKRF